MTAGSGDLSYHTEALSLDDVATRVYEAVANLEYSGQPTTREHIAAAVRLPEDATGRTLDSLVSRGALVRSEEAGRQVFAPAKRGWSQAPDQPTGM